ncbi:SH3 domain-containing protein [Ferrimonas pelagia]|uniref:Protein BatD n=1 Tax=Ferrimonas pelagia TaxID=1177826 RepID=A0ABP9EJ27_9GAMM
MKNNINAMINRLKRRAMTLLLGSCALLPTQALALTAQPTDDWQLTLDPPSQTLWLGQTSEWLLLSHNHPEGEVELVLPQSDAFQLVSSDPVPFRGESHSGMAYTLQLTPLSAQTLALPPVQLRLGEHSRSSDSHRIEVSQPELVEEMQFEIRRSATEIPLGQSISLEGVWTFSYPIQALKAVDILLPELQQDHIRVLSPWDRPDDNALESIGLPVSGRRVIAQWDQIDREQLQIRFRMVIQPTEAGEFSFPAPILMASLDNETAKLPRRRFTGSRYPAYFDNDFFDDGNSRNTRRIMAVAQPLTLTVHALPQPAPDNFSGIIGRPVIEASVPHHSVSQGEPIPYTVSLAHPDIEAIELPALDRQYAFTNDFTLASNNGPARYRDGRKHLTQTLFAKHTEIDAIPALTLSYWDPANNAYREMQIDAIPLEITENEVFSLSDAEFADGIKLTNRVEQDPEGIWAHRWGDRLDAQREPAHASPWPQRLLALILLLPPLAMLSLLAKPHLKQWQARRRQRPLIQFKTALQSKGDPLLALSRYCEQRLGIAPSTLSADRLRQQLARSAPQAGEALAQWLEQDQQRFADRKQTHAGQADTAQLLHWIKQLDKRLARSATSFALALLLVTTAAIPLTADAADSAPASLSMESVQQQHQRALRLSEEHPQRGRNEHAKIAAKLASFVDDPAFDPASLRYNIGSSAFHAGDLGTSILWLHRAERLAPNDERIRHNLAEARAERVDELPIAFGTYWWSPLYQVSQHPLWLAICAAIYLAFWWTLYQWLTDRLQRTASAKRALTGTRRPQETVSLSLRGSLIVAAALLLLAGLSQALNLSHTPKTADGVVMSQEVVGRKGPGLVFAPAFTTPLHQGTEFILLQQQTDWLEVQLSNGLQGWLPNRAIAVFDEDAQR